MNWVRPVFPQLGQNMYAVRLILFILFIQPNFKTKKAIRTCTMFTQHFLNIHHRARCLSLRDCETCKAWHPSWSVTPHLFLFLSLIFPYFSDAHGHHTGSHSAHGPEGDLAKSADLDLELAGNPSYTPSAQIIGVAILEFGVLLHR